MKSDVEPIPDRKETLKKALAVNLSQLLKRRGIKVAEITDMLNDKGSEINSFAVRAWLRQTEKRPTLPSCQNLVYLSEVLGISIEELLGLQRGESASFYQKLREPENQLEREILSILSSIQKEYEAKATRPDYDQLPLRTLFEADLGESSANKSGGINRALYYYLLSNDMVRINPQLIERDTGLENDLSNAWDKHGNGSIIDHACIYKLPNRAIGSQTIYNGVAEVVFLRCAAQYLLDNVVRSGSTIGIGGGKTIGGVIRLLPRSEKLQGCNFFPLLRPSSQSMDVAVSGTAMIADLLFRFGDLGVRMPDDIDKKEIIENLVNVANVLVFTLGGAERSSISRLLRHIRHTRAPEQQERLKTLLAGDILFNVFAKSGYTLEEIAANPVLASPEECTLARELVCPETSAPAAETTNGHAWIAQTRQEYARHIAEVRHDLDYIQKFATRSNRRTILILAGIDKLDILQVFRKRVCRPGMRFTFIAEQSIARALLFNLQ